MISPSLHVLVFVHLFINFTEEKNLRLPTYVYLITEDAR
jgi:hypothetical protein